MRNIVIDSGPLIALFDGSDRYHTQAVRFIRQLQGQLHSNIAVITEVVHMLDFSQQAQWDFLSWVPKAIELDEDVVLDWPRILTVLDKYADLPADFADASLVALCERLDTRLVASVDGDFTVYRDAVKRPFDNLFFQAM